MFYHFIRLAGAALLASASVTAAQAASCVGNCGVSGADGVVTAPPSGSTYNWVSTRWGEMGAGQLPGYGGYNGSSYTTNSFYASAGTTLQFYFNYVTSDGPGYTDYAWAQLTGANPVTLFTARTVPDGSIVPGQDLPPVQATLNPASVPIISDGLQSGDPGPDWSPLGQYQICYGAGCGYTGWIQSTYTIAEAGTYQLSFGATNWADNNFNSGLAFTGMLLDGMVLGDGTSADSPLLPSDIPAEGSYSFELTPVAGQPVFIDPALASGYDYQITSGANAITAALFPLLPGDADGYTIYALGDLSTILGTVMGGQTFTFASPVQGFTLGGIDPAANVDPSDPTAFVTGLTFQNNNAVTVSQTAVSSSAPGAVPEPQTWAMMILGFGLVGMLTRRRRRVDPVASFA
ncbi:MAG: PEP-CTERM sorting domain-containing protein [Novosphingobium sp.]|nr:PEP-CTERM sorting domain-containing protein [Novosphingobium sp.]